MPLTLDAVRHALERDPATGEYRDPHAAYGLNSEFVELYDPPVDGTTPLDGGGLPRRSMIAASQALSSLEKGFTEEPVGFKTKARG